MKIMKKLLLYIVPLLTMFSCSEQLEGISSTDKGIETTISVVIPQLPDAHPQSRVMALNPQLQNLKLAVFDNNGYLLEYVPATLTEQQKATQNETTYGYNVTLRPTDFRTYIHFIGNAPDKIQFGTETEAIGRLFTEGGQEAYWQRIVLPDGIKKEEGNFVQSVIDSLTNVRLVRNFAWIQLESTAGNFKVESYCVVNTYNKGSIAPYNTSRSEFADFANQQTHTDLLSEGYDGFIPEGADLNQEIPDESTWFKTEGKNAPEYAYFIYEREKALSNPPYILVKGNYKLESGTWKPNCYYKVDLRKTDGYFPLIRNFRYNVKITKVMHEGHETAALAAAGSGSGDVSTAIETEDFTNISNGVARIFVNYTDTTLVAQANDLKLRYKFMVFEIEDANGNVTENKVLNDSVEIETSGDVIIAPPTVASSDDNGWREITIQTTTPGNLPKSQDIIIKGAVTIGTGDNAKTYVLQRKVTITLTKEYLMTLECNPKEVSVKQGTPFDVVIKVPGGLRPDMFPLDILLEAENQSMTPDKGDDLPVVTGKSIILGKETKTTIGFLKQIHWEEYEELSKQPMEEEGYLSFACHFKNNKTLVAGKSTIYADNKYFTQTKTDLSYYQPYEFEMFFDKEDLNLEDKVKFEFSVSNINNQGYIYVTLEGLQLVNGEEEILEWDSDLGCYKYEFANLSDSRTGSFNLTPDGTSNPASVKLSAYHFEDCKETIGINGFNDFRFLDFDPDNLTVGSTDEVVEFSFDMSSVPSNDVYVTLTNLVPADDETQLELVDVNIGKYKFKTRPTGTSASITLKNTATEAGTGTVKLTSLYFNNAEESIDIKLNVFSGLTFSPSSVTNGANTPVTFSFNMPTLPSPANVTVTLDGLEPNDSDLTYIKDNADGSKQYTYTPSSNGSQTFDLKTTIDNGTASVKLEADYYDTAQSTLNVSRSYIIPAGNIYTGEQSVTYYIFDYDPNRQNNNNGNIGSFTTNNSEVNNGEVVISTGGDKDGYVYIRYSSNYYGYTIYNVAKVKLSDLMKSGGCDISDKFEPRYY